MTDLVTKARDFAIVAHGDQKYGSDPYVVHLDEVHAVLLEFGQTKEILRVVAYLHDVVEDTQRSLRRIQEEFGQEVESIVWMLTKLYMQPITGYFEGMRDSRGAVTVKLADRIANMRRSLRDGNVRLLRKYIDEHAAFAGICQGASAMEPMWAHLDRLNEAAILYLSSGDPTTRGAQ